MGSGREQRALLQRPRVQLPVHHDGPGVAKTLPRCARDQGSVPFLSDRFENINRQHALCRCRNISCGRLHLADWMGSAWSLSVRRQRFDDPAKPNRCTPIIRGLVVESLCHSVANPAVRGGSNIRPVLANAWTSANARRTWLQLLDPSAEQK